MRTLEVKNWKKVALDRDEWAKLLKKARACRANDDDDEDNHICIYIFLHEPEVNTVTPRLALMSRVSFVIL